jgi:F-type H+-transporting ATPase subunit delta
MKSTRAASRYAKALLDLATERNELESVSNDVAIALQAIKESRDLRFFLSSPVVKHKVKQSVLRQIFEHNLGELTMHFMLLITRQGREHGLSDIFESFIRQYKASKNILDATIKASTTVKPELLNALKAKLETALGKNIQLTVETVPSLIGGYIVEMDNYRLDASLSGSLSKIKRELIK